MQAMHQGAAVLGIGLIAMGEPLGAQMAGRALEHLLQYGAPPVRCVYVCVCFCGSVCVHVCVCERMCGCGCHLIQYGAPPLVECVGVYVCVCRSVPVPVLVYVGVGVGVWVWVSFDTVRCSTPS